MKNLSKNSKKVFILLIGAMILAASCQKIETENLQNAEEQVNYQYSKTIQLFDQQGLGSVTFKINSNSVEALDYYINNAPTLSFFKNVPQREKAIDAGQEDSEALVSSEYDVEIVTVEKEMPQGYIGYTLESITNVNNANKSATSYYGTGFKNYVDPADKTAVSGNNIKGFVFSWNGFNWDKRGHFNFPTQSFSAFNNFTPTPLLRVKVRPIVIGSANWHLVDFY